MQCPGSRSPGHCIVLTACTNADLLQRVLLNSKANQKCSRRRRFPSTTSTTRLIRLALAGNLAVLALANGPAAEPAKSPRFQTRFLRGPKMPFCELCWRLLAASESPCERSALNECAMYVDQPRQPAARSSRRALIGQELRPKPRDLCLASPRVWLGSHRRHNPSTQ